MHIVGAIRMHMKRRPAPARLLPGSTRQRTLDLVMQEQGFLYCADSYADELPYWVDGPHGAQLSCHTHSTPTICGLPRHKASTPATSSLPI